MTMRTYAERLAKAMPDRFTFVSFDESEEWRYASKTYWKLYDKLSSFHNEGKNAQLWEGCGEFYAWGLFGLLATEFKVTTGDLHYTALRLGDEPGDVSLLVCVASAVCHVAENPGKLEDYS